MNKPIASSLPLNRRQFLMTGAAAGAGAFAGLRPQSASAALQIDVTQGNIQPIPIAIPDFLAGSPNEGETPRNISGVIANNLRRSGLFVPIDQQAFIEKIQNFDAQRRFDMQC